MPTGTECFTSQVHFQHSDSAERARRHVFSTCRTDWRDLQPEMPQKPDSIQGKGSYAFDSQRPADSFSQKTKIDDCLGMPLRLRAKAAARDRLSARECGGIACHLQLRRDRGRRSCQQVSDLQSLGCHGGILLRLLSALRPKESVEVDNKVARQQAELRNQCPIILMGQWDGE